MKRQGLVQGEDEPGWELERAWSARGSVLGARHLYSACFSLHPTHPITSRKAINEFTLFLRLSFSALFLSRSLSGLPFCSCASEILITCSVTWNTLFVRRTVVAATYESLHTGHQRRRWCSSCIGTMNKDTVVLMGNSNVGESSYVSSLFRYAS